MARKGRFVDMVAVVVSRFEGEGEGEGEGG